MRRLTLVIALLLCVIAVRADAPMTRDSIEVSVNAGDQSWATFYFGHLPDGTPGSTALIIQCAYDRAELITNFDVYGEQMSSQFFAVTCTRTGPYYPNGVRTVSYAVNAVPLAESLVMTGTDANGNTVKQNLNLTVNSATWTIEGYGRYAKDSGQSEITY